MKTVSVYKVFVNDVLRFESIDRGEIENCCEVLKASEGIDPMIETYQYQPTDHTRPIGHTKK